MSSKDLTNALTFIVKIRVTQLYRWALNGGTFTTKHVFAGRRCTSLKLSSRGFFKEKQMTSQSINVVVLLFSEGLRHNPLLQVRRRRAAVHYLHIWFTVHSEAICIFEKKDFNSAVRQTPFQNRRKELVTGEVQAPYKVSQWSNGITARRYCSFAWSNVGGQQC